MNSPVQANDADVGETPLIDRSSYSQRHFEVASRSEIADSYSYSKNFPNDSYFTHDENAIYEGLSASRSHAAPTDKYRICNANANYCRVETTMMRTAMLRPWARAPVAVSIPSVMSCQPPVVIAPPTRAFASVKHKKLIKVVNNPLLICVVRLSEISNDDFNRWRKATETVRKTSTVSLSNA